MKPLHILSAIALGLTLIATTPIAFAEPPQSETADTVVTYAHPVANRVPGYYGNIACEERTMADWTRLTSLRDRIKACNAAGEQSAMADPPRYTALPDPAKAGNIACAQRAMADWTRLTALRDTIEACNATGK